LRHHVAVVRPAGCPAFAGFADEPHGVLELIKVRDEIDERLEVGELLLAPLLRQLEHYPPALIAVVDKEHAKTFGAILDEIIPLQEVNGTEVRHSRAGGTSAPSNQRKADNRAKANLETAVKTVEREMATGAYQHLYVAGPDEARATFDRMLPERLKKAVAGHLSASLDSSELKHELREKVTAALKG
jgi:Bacterial archaeo-eukaryotic release factor family 10